MSLIDKVKVAVIGAAGLALVSTPGYMCHNSRDTYRVEVTDKQVKRNGDSDKYLVFGKSSEGESLVFQNTDSLWERKWNSSNVQGEIEVGKTYDVETYGWRVPFFSMYENIVDVNPAPQMSAELGKSSK